MANIKLTANVSFTHAHQVSKQRYTISLKGGALLASFGLVSITQLPIYSLLNKHHTLCREGYIPSSPLLVYAWLHYRCWTMKSAHLSTMIAQRCLTGSSGQGWLLPTSTTELCVSVGFLFSKARMERWPE